MAVAHCADARDVATAVEAAVEAGVPFAMRAGAHSFAEYSMSEGLVIDVGDLTSVETGPDTVTVGAGVRVGPLAEHLAPRGRVVPVGWCPMVGVAGASMGGGFGPLGRYFGLACDHLVGADVVLADGRRVRAAPDGDADLLWALRGAGAGNFGAVTSLTFRTRPTPHAYSVAAWWDPDDAATVIDGWQRWSPSTPRHVNMELVLRCWPDLDDPPTLASFGFIVDTDEAGAREHLDALADTIGIPPQRLQCLRVDAAELPVHHTYAGEMVEHLPPGNRPLDAEPGIRFVKSEFFEDSVSRDALAELAEWLLRDRVAGQQRELEFVAWGGAIGDPAPDATAFPHRTARFLLEHSVQAYGSDTLKKESHEWVTRSKDITAPFGNGHVYPNYPDPDLSDWETAYYGPNLPRLRHLKAAYDPDGVFHFDQSIRPAHG
ncbi:FAD-binding oxidoreductase [Stackebrandtia albiflava]